MSNHNNRDLEQLLTKFPALSEQFTKESPAIAETLFRQVDESHFSLVDWVDSLIVIDKWLNHKGASLSLSDRLGYISCAAKSVENSSVLVHLPSLVEEFLKQYGCDRAIKK